VDRLDRLLLIGPWHFEDRLDRVLDAIDLNLRHGIPSSAAVRSGSFLQSIEISNNILPIGLTREIDEHLGAVNEVDRICEKFVEIGIVPGHIRILHRSGEVERRNRAALAPNNAGKGWPDLVLTGRRRMAYCAVGCKHGLARFGVAGT